MKALKIILNIILPLIFIGLIYLVFFHHPGKVRGIMEKYEKEKQDFKTEITKIESRERALSDKILLLGKDIIDANEKTEKADAARGEWERKYSESQAEYEKIKEKNKPKNETEFKALNEEQKIIEYGKLKINLDVTGSRLKECENGLDKNKASIIEYKATLNLQASQIKNFKNGIALKIEKIAEMKLELDKRDATIQALKKITTKINFKKAAIYTAVVLVGIKLIQAIFSK